VFVDDETGKSRVTTREKSKPMQCGGFMRNKSWWYLAQIGIVLLAASISVLAQGPKQTRFAGIISDYTPQTGGGPWQMVGKWSLKVNSESGEADFSAALAMVHSDLGVTLSSNPNLNDPKARNAHTHHITVEGGTITPLANGFRVVGTAIVTANGAYPPPFGPTSTLTIDVTGGTGENSVEFSNIQLTFAGNATTHFGSQPINGVVVRSAKKDQRHEDR